MPTTVPLSRKLLHTEDTLVSGLNMLLPCPCHLSNIYDLSISQTLTLKSLQMFYQLTRVVVVVVVLICSFFTDDLILYTATSSVSFHICDH